MTVKGDESMRLKKILILTGAFLAAAAILCGCTAEKGEEATEAETDNVFISSQVQ